MPTGAGSTRPARPGARLAGRYAASMEPTEPLLVHADAALLVLDKPAGLLAVPGRGEAGRHNLMAWAQQRWPDALVVHRLDMATSGLMLFARTPEAQRCLGTAFAERRIDKRYRAWVAGRLVEAEGCVELPLSADWPRRPRQKVDPDGGRPARTLWRRLRHDTARACSLVELEPVTGRSHQLRVHMAAIGHPILGDALYAPEHPAPRLMLHACRLALAHPDRGERCTFESAPPF